MTDVLYYGDTVRSAAMRHELAVAILDPFLLGIVGDRLHVESNPLETERIRAAVPEAVLHDVHDLGFAELRAQGLGVFEIDLELAARAAAAMGVTEAVCDPDMPVAVADRLRAAGIALRPDFDQVTARRRVKSAAELEGIRTAQHAAEAGMQAAAALLHRAQPDGDRLAVDGHVLTAAAVRAELRAACHSHGAPTPPDVIVGSLWEGGGHEAGSGPLPAHLPIVIDLWPRHEASGCWADMTRTFVVGQISVEVAAHQQTVRDALELARTLARPGITGRELHAAVCDLFEAAGYPTQRTAPGGDAGFQFSLGHGVGLEVHEMPALGPAGYTPLVAGDVIAIEPGLWSDTIGEVRLEDLLLITASGCETLTDFGYDLAPNAR